MRGFRPYDPARRAERDALVRLRRRHAGRLNVGVSGGPYTFATLRLSTHDTLVFSVTIRGHRFTGRYVGREWKEQQ